MRSLEIKQRRNRFIFILAAAAIAVIVIGVAGSLLTTISEQLRNDIKQQVQILTEQAANNVADHIFLTESSIEAFTVQSTDLEEIQPSLQRLKEAFGFAEIAFIRSDGEGCRSDGSAFSAEEHTSLQVISERNGVTYYSAKENARGEYVYQATKPVTINGEEVGMLYAGIPTDLMLVEREFRLFDGEGSFLILEASTGTIIMQPYFEEEIFVEGNTIFESFGYEENDLQNISSPLDEYDINPGEQVRQAIQGGSSTLVTMKIEGAPTYVCVMPVGHGDYYICALVTESAVRSETSSFNMLIGIVFGIIFFCLLSVLAMFLFFYRKRMEERGYELKNQLYGALSDSLEMAVNLYSPQDSTVTPIVAKAREITGYSMAELMSNRRIAERIGLSETGRNLLARLRDGNITATERGEFSLQNEEIGELRWVNYSVTPLLFDNKRQLLVVLRDTTNEKNLQLSMKDAMVAAEAANNAKSDFLSRMSHEIRTPMNAIIGMTQIAKKHLGEKEKVGESLEKITLASDHLLSLINDVLDISKIESGKLMLVRHPFVFSEMIDQVENVVRTQCELKGQSFTVERGEILEDTLMGDEMRSRQVLLNLLSNAVKYTPSGGHISLKVAQEKSPVRGYVQGVAVVSDDGIGMEEEFLTQLFEPFAMEGRSPAQGTGLGMPIVKNIVNMMNGELHVESKKDVGTTFKVVASFEVAKKRKFVENGLAIKKEKSEDEKGIEKQKELEETKIEIAEVDWRDTRVLLAEDNELNAEIAKELLVDVGITVEHAYNGEEVIRMFTESEQGYYDIILMDIQMPQKTGLEATRSIRKLDREDAKKIPIVAMSANAFREDVRASLSSGMNAHLSKPINVQKLLEVIYEQTKNES